jgi:hypothetical protein
MRFVPPPRAALALVLAILCMFALLGTFTYIVVRDLPRQRPERRGSARKVSQ